jgi:CRISPR-associated endonuclease/helicase Cas3
VSEGGVSAGRPFAHTPNAEGSWHLLSDHLAGTGALAGEFASRFGAGDLARTAGWLHDVGKCSCAFSAYLQTCSVSGDEAGKRAFPKRDHKRAGAVLAQQHGYPVAILLAATILGHHGGLSDLGEVRAQLADAAHDVELGETLERARAQLGREMLHHVPVPPDWVLSGATDRSRAGQLAFSRDVEMLFRMIFSALVDADFLDTERHFKPGRPLARSGGRGMVGLAQRFDQRRAGLLDAAPPTPLNAARSEVYSAVLATAGRPPGIYQLATATGSGKTMIGLGWALAHAAANDLRSVVTALPFITVTDQVAGVYRSLLDEPDVAPVVLEHHSAIDVDSDWRKLAAENWDAPVIVTTTVQLFDSLFSNRPSACRKLHRLAGTIIVIDEAQALPLEVLDPVIDSLRSLVDRFGSSVLIMTATQPTLDHIPAMIGQRVVEDLLPDSSAWDAVFARTRIRHAGQQSHDDVAGLVRANDRCLCVLNTIKDARTVAQAVGREEVLYLSTHLRPADRRDRIGTIRARLDRGDQCRVVSTQLIEAGVDLDFPLVLRAMGPLPSLAQADGRCNRNGLMAELGETVIFDLVDGGRPPGAYYGTGTVQTRVVLSRGDVDIRARAVVAEWYRSVLADPTSNLDQRAVQDKRAVFRYSGVADAFRMIDRDTTAVAVPWPCNDPRASQVEEILAFLGSRPQAGFVPLGPRQVRALQEVTVELRRWVLNGAVADGLATRVNDALYRWEGEYDPVTGLVFSPTAQEDLIW